MILDVDRQPATAYKHLQKTPWPLAKTPANSRMGYFQAPKVRSVEPFSADVYPLFTEVLNRQEERSDWNRGHVTHDLHIGSHRCCWFSLIFQGILHYLTNLGLSGHLHFNSTSTCDWLNFHGNDWQLASKLNLAASPGLQNLFTKP